MNSFRLPVVSLFLLSCVLFTQCCKKKSVTQSQETNLEEKNKQPKLQSIDINEAYQWPEKTDQFDILSTRINGDSLLVQVQYGGGCEKHEFTMHTNLMWMKSLPPQLNLWLEHKSNNDMCRALITETIAFDLSAVQNKSTKTSVLILNGDREKSLRYNY